MLESPPRRPIAVWPLSCLSNQGSYRRERGLPTPAELRKLAMSGTVVYFYDGSTGEVVLRWSALTPEEKAEANAAGIAQETHAKHSAAAQARNARRRCLDDAEEAAHASRTLEGVHHD